jgi:hypothetical protein
MVRIDGPRRQVCIKFKDEAGLGDLLLTTRGQVEYKRSNFPCPYQRGRPGGEEFAHCKRATRGV